MRLAPPPRLTPQFGAVIEIRQANFLGLGVLFIGAALGVSMYNRRNPPAEDAHRCDPKGVFI